MLNKLAHWWNVFWEAAKPDPYFSIANLMWLEGYSEREIDEEIARLKEANGDE